ncbi:hypothetical protein P4E94_01145 [Pontiellaceae bacterium B12219]|nr:hypothetical protein [Pontiellaceae bacterium B12219]
MHIVIQNGWEAARKNFGPGLLLQGLALTLVLLYYFYPPFHDMLLRIPAIQERMGIGFPIVVTAFFGGLIPYLFQVVRREIPSGMYVKNLLFMLGFWALMGLSVDLFYTGQALMFGDQPNAATVVKKVCFDQFVFSPFYSAPFSAIAMYWKSHWFSFKESRAHFSREMFTVEIPSVLIALWAVWMPTMAIVYCLPLALQFPLFNIVLCFWSLLLTAMDAKQSAA